MSTDITPVKIPGSAAPCEGRCGAKLVNGRFCIRYPIKGAKRCRLHGSSSSQSKAAAATNVLAARINGELQQRGWEPVTDPIRHYSELGGEALAFKDLAREQVNALQDWALTIGHFMRDEEGGEPEFMAAAEQAKAVVAVYERALDRCDKILGSMLRIGLTAEALRQTAERPTREQADVLVAAMNRLLADPRVVVTGDVRAVVLDAIREVGAQ